MTYILWSSDVALYLENYPMDEGHTWNNGSVWHKHLPHNIYVGPWPVFRGPVILLNILNCLMAGIMDQCSTKVLSPIACSGNLFHWQMQQHF